MAAQTIPPGGLSLLGAPEDSSSGGDKSVAARSAVVLRLNEQIIRDLQQCSKNGKTLRLLAGRAPRIQYGTKTIDLTVSSERCHHELYSSHGAASDLAFQALVTQRAGLKVASPSVEAASGADAALANLKQSLASFAQEKEAKKATISSAVLSGGKGQRNGPLASNIRSSSHATSPSVRPTSAPRSTPATTSSHSTGIREATQTKAMEKALLYYLAVEPRSEEEISRVTHTSKFGLDSRDRVLNKVAQISPGGKNWSLKDKSYKDLDLWKFRYRTNQQRQSAIDAAVRAFDRLRLSRDDKLWQMLLPEHERGKGKVLSRLHSGIANQANRDRASSTLASRSPMPVVDGEADGKLSDSRATPKLGPSSTPRLGSSNKSIEKKLKEAKKQRLADEAKEKKRQDKEAAASDRESKPRVKTAAPVKKPAAKIKSAEVVHSSDEDDDASLQDKDSVIAMAPKKRPQQVRQPAERPSEKKPVSASLKAGNEPMARATSIAKDTPVKVPSAKDEKLGTAARKAEVSGENRAVQKSGQELSARRGTAEPSSKPSTPSGTPSGRAEKHQASSAASARAPQLSPKKADSRPRVPSPLGPTRPRNASNVAGRPTSNSLARAPGAPVPIVKTVRTPVGTLKTDKAPVAVRPSQPSAITKKRPASDSSDEAERPRKSTKLANGTTGATLPVNGYSKASSKPPAVNGQAPGGSDSTLKRKANDMSSGIHDHDLVGVAKHRRTESSSTHSAKFSSGSSANGSQTTTARTSIASPFAGGRSPTSQASPGGASTSSETGKLSWQRALEEAKKFQDYYPEYTALYDRIKALPPHQVKAEDNQKLWTLHRKLEQMKKEIAIAAV